MAIRICLGREEFVSYMKESYQAQRAFSEESMYALYDYYNGSHNSYTAEELVDTWREYPSNFAGLAVSEDDEKKYPTMLEYVEYLRTLTTILDIETNDHTYHLVKDY